MPEVDLTVARRLLGRLDASPTPFHAVATAAAELRAAGFDEVGPHDRPRGPGHRFVRRGGSLIAWATAPHHGPTTGFRVIGAHTDSPNLRVKPRPATGSEPWHQLGVEVYGGALVNSWLDRDLGLAGRVVVRHGSGSRAVLVRDDRPLLRVPQLAIHLDREINEKGLLLNRQQHLSPVWATGADRPDLVAHLASLAEVERDAVLAWDVMAYDVTPAVLSGLGEQFLVSGRIDNLLSCFVGLDAILSVADDPGPRVPVLCLFDHEEVGSVSSTGAGSPLLESVLTRVGAGFGADTDDRHQALIDSLVVSADGAHATHPNYPERHEPDHRIAINAGPVLKLNANQRYATDAETGAVFALACERAGVPVQHFVSRTDLACGSTIGPITAGRLGIAVVDAGCAQLAMHSAREMAGSHDPAWFLAALVEVLRG